MAKANPDSNNSGQKMVPADCVSVLLMAVGNTSISKAQYNMMSALDGTRTASSFEHQFRSITSKAKELKTRADNGEVFEPVQPGNKRGLMSAYPATPKKRKVMDTESEGTTSKKRTPSKKAAASVSPTASLGGGTDSLPLDIDEFIRREKEWSSNNYN
ncbi:hypothetical protein DE146DRAFT_308827 [Phaeosphaeria sp. MPI-PUGE-AT-0046c]|nr:hypothetical protein DE146DRAFT_308827 [Phaeosphaeria sp. MPI-PUGE-AT-0046c]